MLLAALGVVVVLAQPATAGRNDWYEFDVWWHARHPDAWTKYYGRRHFIPRINRFLRWDRHDDRVIEGYCADDCCEGSIKDGGPCG